MAVNSTHPDYNTVVVDYKTMADTYAGERVIKEGGFAYLPPTSGQVKDGARAGRNTAGGVAYAAYLLRAVFPEFVSDAVKVLVGVLHAEPAVIQLPPQLEPFRESATQSGESLQMLLRRINEQQLLYGRIGLLLDFPSKAKMAERGEIPHIVEYFARSIINWDDEPVDLTAKDRLSLVVLDETRFVRGKGKGPDLFAWEQEARFRVLTLGPREAAEAGDKPAGPATYTTWVEQDTTGMLLGEESQPKFEGKTLDQIPFVFIGANDLDPKPDDIPLLPLANLCLAIYRGEADFRQALHMQGQDTLVIIGDEVAKDGEAKDQGDGTEVGAGAIIRIVAGEGAGAKYIGVESKGLTEQAKALEIDRGRAQSMGARLLEPRGSQAESGDALRIRVAASTASLQQVALTAAAGLERALRIAAVWVGADPDAVVVKPNLDFTQETPSPETARSLGEAIKSGLPLSEHSVHAWLQGKNFTKRTFEEEQELLTAEKIRVESEAVTEKFFGMTEPADEDDHDHVYAFWRWPDGTLRGLTAIAADHVHKISDENETEEADGHKHKLMKPVPAPIAPELDENGEPIDPEAQDVPAADGKPDPTKKPAAKPAPARQ